MSEKTRINYLDIAKGVAILAVVWGHFLSPYLLKTVYSFEVSLFFVVSGFFLSEKRDFRSYVNQKAKQLFLPYMVTGIMVIIVAALRDFFRGESTAVIKEDALLLGKAFLYGNGGSVGNTIFPVAFIGPIWFLLALFWALLIVKAVSYSKGAPVYIVVAVVGGMLLSKVVWLPWDINAGMVASGYVYIGFLAKKIGCSMAEQGKNFPIIMEWVMLPLFALLWWFLLGQTTDVILCSNNQYPDGILSGVTSLVGVGCIILLAKLVLEKIPILKRFLLFLGKNTLFLLCVHTVDTRLFQWSFLFDNLPWNLLEKILLIYVLKIALYSFLLLIWQQMKGRLWHWKHG